MPTSMSQEDRNPYDDYIYDEDELNPQPGEDPAEYQLRWNIAMECAVLGGGCVADYIGGITIPREC
jgi:hypothetical protein